MTTLEEAWALQHRIEAWYRRPRERKRKETATPEIGLDTVLLVGTGLVAYGFYEWLVWWIFGGTLIICLAVMFDEDSEKEMGKEEALGASAVSDEVPSLKPS